MDRSGRSVDVIEEYKKRTPTSARIYEEARKLVPGGVNANVKFYPPYPLYMREAKGSKLIDVDGNEYVDFLLGFGPLILGHGHPEITEAVNNHLRERGTTIFGAQDEFMLTMSRKLRHLLRSEFMFRYHNSGTEATMNSIRLARGYTGKQKIAKFEGHYHGWAEYTDLSVSPPLDIAGPELAPVPVPQTKALPDCILKNTIILPFNEINAVEKIVKANRDGLAGIILEPLARGYMMPQGDFLRQLKEVAEENDVLLIFDEVLTGFRIGISSAQGYFGVKPDIIALGKIVGGGFPIGVVGSRPDIMNQLSPEGSKLPDDRIFHSGTFNASSLILAAGLRTLEILERPGSYERIEGTAKAIRDGLRNLVQDRHIKAQVAGIGSIFHLIFTDRELRNYRQYALSDKEKLLKFDLAMYNKGIHLAPRHCCFTSLAHDSEDVQRILEAADDSLAEVSR